MVKAPTLHTLVTSPGCLELRQQAFGGAVKFTGMGLCIIVFAAGASTCAIAQETMPKLTDTQPQPSLLELFERERADSESVLAPTPETTYILGPGDVLEVNILNVSDGENQIGQSTEFLVLVDGTVNLPLIGQVNVQGLTLAQSKERVGQKYAQYVKDPFVTLRLLTPRPLKIVVSGEVYRPGSHSIAIKIKDGEPLPRVTQALKLAGGITTLADLRNVEVRRQVNARQEIIPIDLWALLQGTQANQDILLRDGDTILVPKLETINQEEVRQVGKASFSPDQIQVYVAGEVQTPGLLTVAPNTTMNQALLASGGFLRTARTKSVELVRLNADGTAEKRKIRVDLAQGVNEETNPVLRNGDAILVRRSSSLKLVNFFGGVLGVLLDTTQIFRDLTNTFDRNDERR